MDGCQIRGSNGNFNISTSRPRANRRYLTTFCARGMGPITQVSPLLVGWEKLNRKCKVSSVFLRAPKSLIPTNTCLDEVDEIKIEKKQLKVKRRPCSFFKQIQRKMNCVLTHIISSVQSSVKTKNAFATRKCLFLQQVTDFRLPTTKFLARHICIPAS